MKPDVNCRMQKSLSLVPILNQMTPVHDIQFHLFKIHFNIILPSTVRCTKWHFSDFTTKNPVHISLLPLHATCVVHLIILHFTTRILSGKQPTVTSSFSDSNTWVISKVLQLHFFSLKMNLFYTIHLQAFNVISIVLYHSGPTLGQVLYSCQDAFVVDASDYLGHLIRHLLNASEAFPTEWVLQLWEQVKGWWAHVRTVRRVGKHLPSILSQNFRYCT